MAEVTFSYSYLDLTTLPSDSTLLVKKRSRKISLFLQSIFQLLGLLLFSLFQYFWRIVLIPCEEKKKKLLEEKTVNCL